MSLQMANTRSQAIDEPPLREAVSKLTQDGAAWARAEAELAGAEIAEASRRALMAFGIAVLAGSVALAALVVSAMGAISLLTPVTGGPVSATVLVAVILVAVTILLAWWAWHLAVSTTEATTFIKRWSDALFAKRRTGQ
jgi:VIT1/CCC1 family predicted Fe2+/Mn2+ transporter